MLNCLVVLALLLFFFRWLPVLLCQSIAIIKIVTALGLVPFYFLRNLMNNMNKARQTHLVISVALAFVYELFGHSLSLLFPLTTQIMGLLATISKGLVVESVS